MNNTTYSSDDPDDMGGESIAGFGFEIGLFVGVLIIFLIITYVCYAYARMRTAPHLSAHRTSVDSAVDGGPITTIQIQQGLTEATLLTYPKFLYSEVKVHKADSGCSICLADYKATDMLRLLPDCGHQFHLKCIDPWLMLHATCPICRNSPLPTPLAEVVPLPVATTQN